MADCLRTHWFQFVIAGICAAVFGLILLIIGIYYVATGEDSTVGKHFLTIESHFTEWARPEVAATSTIITAPGGDSNTYSATNELQSIVWSNGTTTYWDGTFVKLTIPRSSITAITNSDGEFRLSFRMSYLPVRGSNPTTQTSTVTTAAIPYSNATGWAISRVCAVITREYANSEWIIADKKSCYYPFKATSNPYVQSVGSSALTVELRSERDPLIYIQDASKGVSPVVDANIVVVDSKTPGLLGGGAFFLVGGLLTIIIFACCCRPKPLDNDPTVQGQPAQQPYQQGVPLKTV